MTDAERIARLEAELEQLRKAFAHERSTLENDLACAQHQYGSDREDLNAALEDVAKLRVMLSKAEEREKWKDAPRVLNPVSPNTTVEHPPRRYCRECSQPLDDAPLLFVCAPCATRAARTAPVVERCPDCGVTRLPGDDGCSWCGPGAHR